MSKAFSSADPHTGFHTVTSAIHRIIHDGFYFTCTGKTSVASLASYDILFAFPANLFGHLTVVEFAFDDAPIDVQFFEDVTTSAEGTAANVRNHNRAVAIDGSDAAITLAPTVTDTGTLLHTSYVPSGGNNIGQIVSAEDAEWIVGGRNNAPMKFLWRITNGSTGTINFAWHFNGYELHYR